MPIGGGGGGWCSSLSVEESAVHHRALLQPLPLPLPTLKVKKCERESSIVVFGNLRERAREHLVVCRTAAAAAAASFSLIRFWFCTDAERTQDILHCPAVATSVAAGFCRAFLLTFSLSLRAITEHTLDTAAAKAAVATHTHTGQNLMELTDL